jgi:hypothetical protein
MVTASATTHSFEPRDFPETAKKPAIGGLSRLRFGRCRDDFWPEGDFGQFVSGPRNPVSPMQDVLEAGVSSEAGIASAS